MGQKPPSLSVRYRFERCSPGEDSALEALARRAHRVVETMPSAVVDCSASRASRLAAGLSVPLPAEERLAGEAPGDRVRITAIEDAQRLLLQNSYDADGRLVQVTYPDGENLRYRYDGEGRLVEASCNRRMQIRFQYDAHGRRLRATYGPTPSLTLACEWSGDNRLRRLLVPEGWVFWQWDGVRIVSLATHDGVTFEFELAADHAASSIRISLGAGEGGRFRCATGAYAVVRREGRDGAFLTVSPFGLMRHDASGRVQSWLRFDGEPMGWVYDREGRIVQVWSRTGAASLDHGPGGVRSVVRADGRKHLLWPIGQDGRSLMIAPDGVTLVRSDRQGRITSMLGSWGASTSYGYGLLGRSPGPRVVSSPQWGRMVIRYDGPKRIRRVAIAGKGSVTLKYDRDGRLAVLRLKGDDPGRLADALRTAGLLYCLRAAGPGIFSDAFKWAHLL
jgi:YD repeat-containing protein